MPVGRDAVARNQRSIKGNTLIAIVDYGAGNYNSVANLFRRLEQPFVITSDPQVLRDASKLILPGVGNFGHCMSNLRKSGLIPLLYEKVAQKTPLLGICVGMQMLTSGSEESDEKGLGWIEGETVRFSFGAKQLRIPHVGFNTIKHADHPIFARLPEEPRFYFTHSYHVKCRTQLNVLATTSYGYEFVSVIAKDNIYGVQFHPEKSHRYGLLFISGFLEVN